MSVPFDPMRDPFFVVGDETADLPLWRRALWRGVRVKGTTPGGQPANPRRLGYLFRHAVTIERKQNATQVPPAGQNGPSLNPDAVRWGAFGFAVPVIAVGLRGAVNLAPLLGRGVIDQTLEVVQDATLPDGTKEYLRGDSGCIVSGLDPNNEQRVFISDRAKLYAHHLDNGAETDNISTRVYDVAGDVRGAWAGLNRGLAVTSVPPAFKNAMPLSVPVALGVV